MDRLTKILSIVALVIMALLLVTGVGDKLKQQKEAAEIKPQQLDTGVLHVIVIDVNDVSTISHEQLMKAQNAILLYLPKDRENEQPPRFLTFNGVDSLSQFDVDKDGTISLKEPIYAQLYIGIISEETKQMRYVTIESAGIVSIHLGAEENAKQPEIAYVVMSDGSHRAANIIKMYEKELEGLRPIPLQ